MKKENVTVPNKDDNPLSKERPETVRTITKTISGFGRLLITLSNE